MRGSESERDVAGVEGRRAMLKRYQRDREERCEIFSDLFCLGLGLLEGLLCVPNLRLDDLLVIYILLFYYYSSGFCSYTTSD
jgi:hypothetical protein